MLINTGINKQKIECARQTKALIILTFVGQAQPKKPQPFPQPPQPLPK